MPQSETRIRILKPAERLAEGVQTLPTDLHRFFVIVRRVGRDSGLLLLTIRALRHRSAGKHPMLGTLAWTLRARRTQILRWLDDLAREGLLVYDDTEAENPLILEIAELGPLRSAFDPAATMPTIHHELPTHHFVHVLPRVGRRTFVVYLYLLAQERSLTDAPEPTVEGLVEAAALRNVREGVRELKRLARLKLLAPHPSGVLILRDPPPITRMQRWWLKLRARGLSPHVRSLLWLLPTATVLLGSLLYLLLR